MSAFIVDRHPKRTEIINAILAGTPLKRISKTISPHIDYQALWRYRRNRTDHELRNAISADNGTMTLMVTPDGSPTSHAVPMAIQTSAIEIARNRLLNRL